MTAEQSRLDFDAPTQPRTAALESFHVRSHMTAEEALEGERRANRQEALVLAYLRSRPPGLRVTPSALWSALGGEAFGPLTSLRRALTNLTVRGVLVHHQQERRVGPYGSKESCWSLAE